MYYKILVVLSLVGFVLSADWTYYGEYGPLHWGDHYESCNKASQSPIDIPHAKYLQYDDSLDAFSFSGYNDLTGDDLSIKNNGHTVQVSIAGDSLGKAYITGGGLPGKYIAAQFHFHWGKNSSDGSEHTFRGRPYPLELHIVHYAEKYGDIASCLNKADGLAVLGFFFRITDDDNQNIEPLVTTLSSILYKDQTGGFNTSFDKFLAGATDEFYRYQGSLTTPPCSEAVIWTVFENKITISERQLAAFRDLYETEKDTPRRQIGFNFRPLQRLGVRVVKKNYMSAVPPSFHWGYHGEEAPDHWQEYYPTCQGNQQSPIDIPYDEEVKFDAKLANLTFINYDKNVTGEIHNNGHTLQVNIFSPDIYIESGGLKGRYKAAQFHYHWGHGHHGSEHKLQGDAYPMELHIVHYKEEYGSLAGALDYKDGLAVIGFLIVEGNKNHMYTPIIDALPGVQLKGLHNPINGFTLKQITHKTLKLSGESGSQIPFYRYDGGLTTPPCSQIVTWSVMMAKIHLHAEQIDAFRQLAHVSSISGELHYHDMILENYRPVQDIAGRTVYTSYPLIETSGAAGVTATTAIIAAILFFFVLSS